MTDMMDIGVSGILAFQAALNVTSNNIANASDPNYCRKVANLTEMNSARGVNVSDISRIVDINAIQYAQATNTNFAELDTYSTQLQSMVSLFGNNSTGIGKSIMDSLGTLRDLSTTPADNNSRNSYLSRLGTVTQQFQSVSSQISTSIQNVNQSFTTDVDQINALVKNIADINAQIQNRRGQDQGSLLDERDSLVDKLSTYMDFTTHVDDQGIMDISLSNGMRLLSGTTPSVLTTFNDPSNSENLLVGMINGSTTMDLSHIIHSGQIAGLYNFRQDAAEAQISINRLSLAFSQTFNDQNKLGIDTTGNFGGNIFSDINSSAAIQTRASANANNTGTGGFTVDISNVSQLQASDYQLIVGAGNSYSLKRLSDNTTVSSGTISGTLPQTINVDGFNLNINSGTFNAGDKYTISPTKNAASTMSLAIIDGSKISLAMPVIGVANSQNLGTGALTVKEITDPSNSTFTTPQQLSPPIRLVFDSTGANYSLINATTSAVIEGPIPYSAASVTGTSIFPTPGGYDPGYRIDITGTIKPNDSFDIEFNTNNSTDFRNGDLMTKLYQKQIINGGKATFNQAYNATATAIFTKGESAVDQSDVAKKIKSAADNSRDEVSGVSLADESMNIQRYQQAYQASAQILQSAKATFDMLLQMFR